MPSTSAPMVGSTLVDRYDIVRRIARGGMGEVYEAHDRLLQRPVAVKVYRGTAPADRTRFDAEVRVLAALNHPGLVHVFDAGEHDGDGFVVLELVDGPDLRAILGRRGALPARDVAALGAPLAAALAYVHAQGIVHRDVKPANVLCGKDGRPRLADFGIARLLDTTRVTATATAVGTPAYLAPEQLEGRDVTPAADVYALGLVLLEALTGRPAFEGSGSAAALARLVRDPDVGTGVPEGWGPLLEAMTARDPDARPPAAAVAADLATRARGGAPARATPPVIPGVVAVPTGAGAGPADAEAATEVLLARGGTTVMPAALLPPVGAGAPAAPRVRLAAARARRWLWAALAVLALVVGLVLASAGGGIDVPASTTTTAPVAVTTPTTVPTTAPPATEAPAGNGKGHGKGKGHDD